MGQKTDFNQQPDPPPRSSELLMVNGKPLRELNDLELNEAVVWVEANLLPRNQSFAQVQQQHLNFHAMRGAVLYEQERRRHGLVLLNGVPPFPPDGKPPG